MLIEPLRKEGAMSVRVMLAVLLLMLGGCAGEAMTEQPMTAADMPVTFDAPQLASASRTYRRTYNSSDGTDLRVMSMSGEQAFAIVNYIGITGNYLFRERSTRSWLGSALPDSFDPVWGESGTIANGPNRTGWQAFDLDQQMRCLGLTRPAKWHHDGAAGLASAQGMVVTVYCREGSAPLDAEDAADVAAGLRVAA
jgi:hypothetical protein